MHRHNLQFGRLRSISMNYSAAMRRDAPREPMSWLIIARLIPIRIKTLILALMLRLKSDCSSARRTQVTG